MQQKIFDIPHNVSSFEIKAKNFLKCLTSNTKLDQARFEQRAEL